MIKIQADYIFPIASQPIKNGIVIYENDGKIVDIINPVYNDYQISDIKCLKGIICPGFINTHAHLEYSFMKNKIKSKTGLNNFIIQLQNLKKSDFNAEIIPQIIKEQDDYMFFNGISACADICNSEISASVKADSNIFYHNIIEVFASDSNKADIAFLKAKNLLFFFEKYFPLTRLSISPHSFYAASDNLLKKVFCLASELKTPLSIHHLESSEENDYFYSKTGSIPERMKYFNVDISAFIPSGKSSLKTFANDIPKDSNLMLVHNTYAQLNDILFAERKFNNLWWCLCPNSNTYIENKLPDLNIFLQNNCNITIGTDSLASNKFLNVLYEIKTLQKRFNIDTNTLLKFATINGAKYLNIDNQFGTIEKNKKPGLVIINNVKTENLFFTSKSQALRII